MGNSHRREFLKKSILGLSAATLIPGTVNASSDCKTGSNDIPVLPARTLGNTGIRTPLISLGAGSTYDPNFVRAAYFAGVKLFFSATYYGEGNNERMVGEGLKDLARESFIIGTAIPADDFDNRLGLFKTPFDADVYIRKAEASLTRFGLEYVDFLMFPYAGKRNTLLHEPLMKAMRKLREQGKTRFIGIATHGDCAEALRAAAESNLYDVVMTAYNYKTPNLQDMNEAISYATRAGLGVVAMKTNAGVTRDKTRTQPLNTDAALKWVLQNKDISSIVSGMTSVEQLQKNIAMLNNLNLTEQERKDIDLISLGSEPGLYCHQCRQCIPQCPDHIEIPTVMRSYMYAYGYRNMEQAQFTLAEADLKADACEKCEECSVRCAAGFNVKERVMDISRLKNIPREFLVS